MPWCKTTAFTAETSVNGGLLVGTTEFINHKFP